MAKGNEAVLSQDGQAAIGMGAVAGLCRHCCPRVAVAILGAAEPRESGMAHESRLSLEAMLARGALFGAQALLAAIMAEIVRMGVPERELAARVRDLAEAQVDAMAQALASEWSDPAVAHDVRSETSAAGRGFIAGAFETFHGACPME